MPIRPENRARYPADWPKISLAAKQRAGWRCVECGVRHLSWGYREADGTFVELPQRPLREAGHRKPPFRLRCDDGRVLDVIEIVLTTAHHPDPDPANCAPENLKVWCQLHHNRADAAMRLANRLARERAEMRTPDLFGEGRAA